jgi:hypothetical protein
VYFKAEEIVFRFSSSRVYINANYTFQNENMSTVNINILLPFIISGSNEAKPPILENLMVEGTDLDYTWKQIQIPLLTTHANFQALEFTLQFIGQEEKIVTVQYNRDYQNGAGSWDSRTRRYNFQYCVGTALAWNHNISSADFEFWIPKSICDEINNDNYFDGFEETDTHFIGILHYTNWLPEEEMISIWWEDEVLFSELQIGLMRFALIMFGVPIGLLSLGLFLRRLNKRRNA